MKEKFISFNCGKNNSFLFCVTIIFYLTTFFITSFKNVTPLISEDFKEKDILLISPILTYIFYFLCHFFKFIKKEY